jgi:hypothetical protein
MGRMLREHSLPFIKGLGALDMFKHARDVPDSDVTPDYIARHHWITGHCRREDRGDARKARRLRHCAGHGFRPC